ncbi:MAG: flagellar hook-length control protein FliK [Acidobacteria bacterium]|nr:flagellar hook-length control protein FliK [Acidobacteriota bacterium]MBI3657835.1 flagellar hook-length control protein FliK [Acidobacteriota bacterium]
MNRLESVLPPFLSSDGKDVASPAPAGAGPGFKDIFAEEQQAPRRTDRAELFLRPGATPSEAEDSPDTRADVAATETKSNEELGNKEGVAGATVADRRRPDTGRRRVSNAATNGQSKPERETNMASPERDHAAETIPAILLPGAVVAQEPRGLFTPPPARADQASPETHVGEGDGHRIRSGNISVPPMREMVPGTRAGSGGVMTSGQTANLFAPVIEVGPPKDPSATDNATGIRNPITGHRKPMEADVDMRGKAISGAQVRKVALSSAIKDLAGDASLSSSISQADKPAAADGRAPSPKGGSSISVESALQSHEQATALPSPQFFGKDVAGMMTRGTAQGSSTYPGRLPPNPAADRIGSQEAEDNPPSYDPAPKSSNTRKDQSNTEAPPIKAVVAAAAVSDSTSHSTARAYELVQRESAQRTIESSIETVPSHAQPFIEGVAGLPQDLVPNALSRAEEAGRHTLDTGLLQELAEKAQALTQAGGRNEIRMSLYPENLGELRLRATLEGNHFSVSIATGSAEAKDFLERHLHLLQTALSDQGLNVDHIEIRQDDSFFSASYGESHSSTQQEPSQHSLPFLSPGSDAPRPAAEGAEPLSLATLVGESGIINLLV